MYLNNKKPVELHRTRYWQGQMLRSRDLRDQRASEDHLRWWHNRGVHQAFGIAYGFEVQWHDGTAVCANTPLPDKPQQLSVVICPGVAYDCFGRELLLFHPEIVPLPPAIDRRGVALLARYRAYGELDGTGEASPFCLPGGTGRLERPLFYWKPAYLVTPEDGVPLAYCDGDGALMEQKARPQVRGMKRPLIANGATIPGNTAWQVWQETTDLQTAFPAGIEVEIDTSAAGFTEVPCYFAWLSGSLWSWELVEQLAERSSIRKTVADDYQKLLTGVLLLQLLEARTEHIHAQTQTQFTFRLWLPHVARRFSSGGNTSSLLAVAQMQQLSVCWLGIQPTTTL